MTTTCPPAFFPLLLIIFANLYLSTKVAISYSQESPKFSTKTSNPTIQPTSPPNMYSLTIVTLTPLLPENNPPFPTHPMSSSSTHSPMTKRLYIPPSPNLGGTVFPNEIMEEILSHVPCEDLSPMKQVNKTWYATINDGYFAGVKHVAAMKLQNWVGFILQSQMGFYPLGYEPTHPSEAGNKRSIIDGDPEWHTIASCNSFILNCTMDDRFFIENPMLNEFWEILTPKILFPEAATFASAFYGLGCVPGTSEYKIVRIVLFNTHRTRSMVHCYSTRTRVWRYICDFPYDYPVWSPGVYAGGCLNWQISTVVRIEIIASFNCTDETFRIIRLPQGRSRITAYGDVGCIDDDNLVIYSSISYSFEDCELWVLDNFADDGSWKRIIFEPGYAVEEEEFILGIQPLRLLRSDGRRLLLRVEPSGRFVEYDLIDKVYIPVDGPNWQHHCCSTFPFTQSIARLI